MMRALSRLVVRVSIVAASLAWAGFVFTNTVGDPGRGERIATAVLDDHDARAEVVAPIASAVVRTAGLPATEQPAVAARVDALLQDPATARTFIDPFAGQWERMLGADVAPAEGYDVGPLLDEILAATPGFGAGAEAVGDSRPTGGTTEELLVSAVPLPQARFDWLLPSRRTMTRTTSYLAAVAAIGFAFAFVIGNRRWVLRRLAAWATVAGAGWVLVPIVAVWAARRWATGADSVIAVAVEQAVSGLRPTALVLLVFGVLAFAGSFAPLPTWLVAPWAPLRPDGATGADGTVGQRPEVVDARHGLAALATATVAPAVGVPAAADRWPTVDRTAEIPIVDGWGEETLVMLADGGSDVWSGDDHHDPLWGFYS
jgi:hypothetical protein